MQRRSVRIGDAEFDVVVGGEGPVTVVFENGMAMPLEVWDDVVPSIAAVARTVRYDRRRAPPGKPMADRSPGDIVSDLEAVLAALKARPPYVLVGHSWGGVIVRLFAHAHPSEVAGLVFVDATHEALGDRTLALLPVMYGVMRLVCRAAFVRRAFARHLCPPASPPAYRARVEQRLREKDQWAIGVRTARAESAAIGPALAQLRGECPDLPAVRIHVLTSGVANTSARRVHAAWEAAAARAANARYTNVAQSSHNMPVDARGAVVGAIMDVLARASVVPSSSPSSVPSSRPSLPSSGP
jgi:pimeloyl-ACP methyl ester carboxylesterase